MGIGELIAAGISSVFFVGGTGAAIGGGTLTIAGISAATVINFAVAVALTGAQFIMQSMMAKRAQLPGDQGVKQNVRQSDPPQRRVYGRVQTGGAIFFWETKNPFLYVGYCYNRGEIEGVESFAINGKRFRIDQAGNAIDAPFYRPDGTVFLKVSVQTGADDQPIDPLLAADFPELPETFRQPGAATIVFRAHYGTSRDQHDEIYGSGGQFEPQITLKGALVYDPRDPAQERDNPATWAWSRTASLIIADYLRDPAFGNVDPDRIDWASVAAAADRDDEPVALKDGGFQARYTIDGVVDTSQNPRDVVNSMLTANRGRLVIGEKVRLFSGSPQAPIGTLHDGMIVGSVEFRGQQPRANLVNRIRTEFIAEDRDWTNANGPVMDFTAEQVADGGIYEQTISLPFTATHQRAQRLARAFVLDARAGRYLTAEVSLEAMQFFAENAGCVIRVDLTWLPSAAGLYLIERVDLGFNPTRLLLTLSEYTDAIEEEWIPDLHEMPFEIEPAEL